MVSSGVIPSSGWVGAGQVYPNYTNSIANYTARWLNLGFHEGDNLCLAIHTPAGAACALLYRSGSGEYRAEVIANDAARNSGIQWFLFSTAPPPAVSSGFELYIPSVRRVYSTGAKPMRPLAILTGTSQATLQNDYPTSASGKKLAAVVVKASVDFWRYGEMEGGGWFEQAQYSQSMFTVNYGPPQVVMARNSGSRSTSGGGGTPYVDEVRGSIGMSLLLVDVTGY